MNTRADQHDEPLDRIFEILFDAVFELTAEGRFLRANAAFTALLGYGPDDIAHLRFADIGATLGQDAEMDDSLKEHILRFELYPLMNAERSPVPCTLLTKSKERIPVILRSVLLRDNNDSLHTIFGSVTPERRTAPRRSAAQQNDQIREPWETEELYRSILKNSGDAVIITDFNGWIVNANDACIRMFGCERTDEMLGRYLLEFIPMEGSYSSTTGDTFVVTQEYYDSQVSQIETLFEAGLAKTNGYLFKKDKTVFPVEATMSLLRDKRGQHRGTITICRDITERSKFEARLSQAREELERTVVERTQDLQDANTALRVLLKNREDERLALEKKIMSRVHELVMPYVEKLQNAGLNERQRTLLDILGVNLKNIVAPFEHALTDSNLLLTPMESQVANLVQHGRTTKDIAEALSLSPKTVEFHRDAIRRKLGIHNKKISLRNHLLSRS